MESTFCSIYDTRSSCAHICEGKMIRPTFGVVIVLSFLFFSLYTYRISHTVPAESNPDSWLQREPNNSLVKTTSMEGPQRSCSTVLATASPSPCPKISPSQLDVEQIASDFPMGYSNPNPSWFKRPGKPQARHLMRLLSEEEREMLPSFRDQSKLSPGYLEKISSFYGINRAGSWQEHISSLDDDGLAPLTKWSQNFIYKHQHPESCEGKKFYKISNNWPHHGLGALVRRVFIELSFAIQTDRILVFDTYGAPGDTLLENDCNKHRGKGPSLECILEEITSCADYATEENTVSQINPVEFPTGHRTDIPPIAMVALMTYMGETGLQASGALLRYWWRAQLYGYILRPNRATLDRMAEMRLNETLHGGIATNRGRKPQDIPVPFPFPRSTVSMHIRHGDKAGEGRLISTRDYIVAAERFLLRNPLVYRKRAFLSTEDPKAVKEVMRTAFVNPVQSYGNLDWSWYWSKIPRVNSGPHANLEITHNKTDALITHIMQLWMAVECDTFVGNRNSNWNKMIDAIRCTLMDKCRSPYLDAGFVADWIYFP
ncbi:hypothetical protein ABW19_dt0203985 [Dactylella cylindrospora]|nr:hypothetical protein ABW19_dt0203985 [Dactylella cylindrospora]